MQSQVIDLTHCYSKNIDKHFCNTYQIVNKEPMVGKDAENNTVKKARFHIQHLQCDIFKPSQNSVTSLEKCVSQLFALFSFSNKLVSSRPHLLTHRQYQLLNVMIPISSSKKCMRCLSSAPISLSWKRYLINYMCRILKHF